MPVIGFLDSRPSDAISDRLRAFRQGLKDTGYVESENVAVIHRFAENQVDRLPELATELVQRRVAVFAAKAATASIPIVFVAAEDPVKLGLVASIARPSGNLTGINLLMRSWWPSGWICCASWCPGLLALPCSSIQPMWRVPRLP